MGQPAKNDPRSLIIWLLLKSWLRPPYRNLVSFLGESTYLWAIMGLKVLPGRMDLQGAMNRLTKEYLSELQHVHLGRRLLWEKRDSGEEDRRTCAVDSTCFSIVEWAHLSPSYSQISLCLVRNKEYL